MAQFRNIFGDAPFLYKLSRTIVFRANHPLFSCGLCIIYALILVMSLPAVSISGLGDQFSEDDSPEQPWEITADEISHDQEKEQYTAIGNAFISKANKNLSADYVLFDNKASKLIARGNVVLKIGDDTLTGSSLEMNLDAEIGSIENGTIFIKEDNFHISGKRIEKIGEKTYTIENATLTTCDGDVPDWKLTAKSIKVTLEKYALATHAAMWAKKVPFLYTPLIAVPVKSKRSTGFLTPEFGFSDRKGFEYAQPFFWAISENTDATFYAHYMSLRGLRTGAEYRYILDEKSKGTVMLDFLYDDKVDNGSPDNTDAYGYDGDMALRTNHTRYWFRMKQDQALPKDFFAKIDLDIVSDQDYLRELKGKYAGFKESENYFDDVFGRELDDYDDPVRINRVNVSRLWPSYSLNIEARWYDDVIKRRWANADDTLQMLPFVEFNASKQQIMQSPFYFDLDSEYTHFFRQDGTASRYITNGHRIDIHPRVYWPFRFKNYFTFEPSIGLRETAWYIADTENEPAGLSKMYSRELYDVKLDLSSEFFRIFNVNKWNIDKIKHAIEPQIVYDYIPKYGQSHYPYFDGYDRIRGQNMITYGITNTFTSRSIIGADSGETHLYSYDNFLRAKLWQSFDFNKKSANDPEPFSPIYLELDFKPIKYFSFGAEAGWSVYESDFVSHNIHTTVSDNRGDRFYLEYRYKNDLDGIKNDGDRESIYSDLKVKITNNLSAFSSYERNLYDHEDIKMGVGLRYLVQCWAIDLEYSEEGRNNDVTYAIMVHFYGIGGLGQSTDIGSRFGKPFLD